MRPSSLIFLLAGSLAFSATAHAQLCKWTDENGTVHYDTECPEEVDAKDVDVSDALSTTGPDPYADSRKAAEQARNASSSQQKNAGGSARGSGLSCEQAREKRLKPERDRLIAQCKAKGDKDAAQCARFYANYGDGGRQGGRTMPPKYMNIPECQGQ